MRRQLTGSSNLQVLLGWYPVALSCRRIILVLPLSARVASKSAPLFRECLPSWRVLAGIQCLPIATWSSYTGLRVRCSQTVWLWRLACAAGRSGRSCHRSSWRLLSGSCALSYFWPDRPPGFGPIRSKTKTFYSNYIALKMPLFIIVNNYWLLLHAKLRNFMRCSCYLTLANN
jgi:hypothetical protein